MASPISASAGVKDEGRDCRTRAELAEDMGRDYPLAALFSQLTPAVTPFAPKGPFLTHLAAHVSIALCPSTQHGLWNLSYNHGTS
jgi:hypothetical protein